MFEEILLQFHHTKLARQLKNTITYILIMFYLQGVRCLISFKLQFTFIPRFLYNDGLSAVCSDALSTLLFIGVEVNITIINHVPIILKLILKISVFVYIYIYLETKNFMFVLQLNDQRGKKLK